MEDLVREDGSCLLGVYDWYCTDIAAQRLPLLVLTT